MTEQEVTQEQFERLLEDAAYLQDEAEALRYVIDNVPYDETPPEGESILYKLLLLDHVQVSYYRPVFEKLASNPRSLYADDFQSFRESFEVDENDSKDIQKVLGKLAKHRAALINILENISLIDWERELYKDNLKISLYDFANEMIRNDRKLLKEIADMVMVYQKDMQQKRELEGHRKNRQGNHRGEEE